MLVSLQKKGKKKLVPLEQENVRLLFNKLTGLCVCADLQEIEKTKTEMASINSCADTPNKRRRRELKCDDLPAGGGYDNTNRLYVGNKENNYMGMEVKSIAQMIADKTIDNPFEVIRKPPKKKKKTDIADSCFVNPALNLNGPEVVLNPFEIKRIQPTKAAAGADDLCFVNSGLNIRGPDNRFEQSNAFEISRSGCGELSFFF